MGSSINARETKVLETKQETPNTEKAVVVSWRQKSRWLWLKERGKNTKSLPADGKLQQRVNCTHGLKVGDETIEDKDLIRGKS